MLEEWRQLFQELKGARTSPQLRGKSKKHCCEKKNRKICRGLVV
jgi:hypothetical protein